MDYALFILLNALLLMRPEDLFSDLTGARLYLITIAINLAVAGERIVRQLSPKELVARPVTVCVLSYWIANVVSSVFRFGVTYTIDGAMEFGKVILYYLLLVAVVNTPQRLQNFLSWIVVFAAVQSSLGLLQQNDIIYFEALIQCEQYDTDPESGEMYLRCIRLCGCGMFNDPNDLCLLLAIGIALSLYKLTEAGSILALRCLWVGTLTLFAYALAKTESRGGFLAVVSGVAVIGTLRFGWRRGLPLLAIGLPLIFLVFGGRQTELSTGGGTGQSRLQHWAEALAMLPRAPLFGIGNGEICEEIGLVAHNSYVQAFVENGLIGGTCFVAMIVTAIWGVALCPQVPPTNEALYRFRPYLLAAVAGYAAGMFTLTRNMIIPTYLLLGLACVYQNICLQPLERTWFRSDRQMAQRLIMAGAAALTFLKLFVMAFVRY